MYVISPIKCLSNNAIGDYLKFSFEKVHLSFIHFCLGVHKKSTNIAVLSELGEYPLTLKIFNTMCKNWLRVVHMNPDSLLYDCFLCNVENIHTGKLQWLIGIRDTLCNLGFQTIWENIGLLTNDFPTLKFREKCRRYFREQWKEL